MSADNWILLVLSIFIAWELFFSWMIEKDDR